jgi:hypothetical protein
MPDDGNAYTVKELVLRIDAKLDTYISTHEARHLSESRYSQAAASDPTATAAGRQLVKDLAELTAIVKDHDNRIESMEKTIWRAVGAIAVLIVVANLIGPILLEKIGLIP